MDHDEAIAFLTRDGNLGVPCSRWGRDSLACAEVAYDLDVIVSAGTGRGPDAGTLEEAMSLVVNDHDGVTYILHECGGAEIREKYADETGETHECSC